MSSSRFAKREREKAKRERADRKRARREDRREAAAEADTTPTPAGDQTKLLGDLEALHRAYDNEELSLEDFEEQRAALLEQLQV